MILLAARMTQTALSIAKSNTLRFMKATTGKVIESMPRKKYSNGGIAIVEEQIRVLNGYNLHSFKSLES